MGVFDSIQINLSVLATPEQADFMRRFCIVSDGKSTLQAGNIQMVTAEDWKSYVTGENEVSTALASFFLKAIGKVCYIFECGGTGDAEAKLQALESFIDEATMPCYEYLLPKALYQDDYLQTMLIKYGANEQSVYFSANLVADSQPDPTQQPEYAYWTGQKAFMGVYPSFDNASYNTAGAILGVKASSAFDISTSNRMSSLEYKYCGATSKTLGSGILNKIAQAPCAFTMMKGVNNGIRNSKMGDGRFWHYRYALDNLIFLLKANVDTLFVNASNTPNGALEYNNGGIQSIKQNLVTTLTAASQMGLVNRFAQSIDLSTGALTGLGDIASIPFEEYKANNPQNYSNGVYGGYSGYIEIMEFIVKIEFNVTIG